VLRDTTTGQDNVMFVQVMLALGKYLVKKNAEKKGEELEEIPETLLKKTDKALLSLKLKNDDKLKKQVYNMARVHASKTIQRAVRVRRMAKAAKLNGISGKANVA
jgi:hypothetical protein